MTVKAWRDVRLASVTWCDRSVLDEQARFPLWREIKPPLHAHSATSETHQPSSRCFHAARPTKLTTRRLEHRVSLGLVLLGLASRREVLELEFLAGFVVYWQACITY